MIRPHLEVTTLRNQCRWRTYRVTLGDNQAISCGRAIAYRPFGYLSDT
jgi:hypothetical protein